MFDCDTNFVELEKENGEKIVAITFGSSKENLYLCLQITKEVFV